MQNSRAFQPFYRPHSRFPASLSIDSTACSILIPTNDILQLSNLSKNLDHKQGICSSWILTSPAPFAVHSSDHMNCFSRAWISLTESLYPGPSATRSPQHAGELPHYLSAYTPDSWTAVLGDYGTSSYVPSRGLVELLVCSTARYTTTSSDFLMDLSCSIAGLSPPHQGLDRDAELAQSRISEHGPNIRVVVERVSGKCTLFNA
jgi:hypothetical protein